MDCLLEFRTAAVKVYVLDAQQHASAGRPRQIEVEQGGIGVPEMQIAVRGGREAESLVGETSRHSVGPGGIGSLRLFANSDHSAPGRPPRGAF